jgi:hypothetical protein
MSSIEQDVIRCLIKHPQSTPLEIAEVVKIAVAELEVVLRDMVSDDRLVEEARNGQRAFAVRFKRDPKPTSSNLLTDLFG